MRSTFFMIVLFAASFVANGQKVQFDEVFDVVSHDLGFDTGNVQINVRDAYLTRTINPTDEPAAATVRLRREFYRIDIYFSMERDRMIRALIHEFVHVAQMRSERLVVTRHSIIYDEMEYTQETDYSKRPFEVDAIRIADELFTKYFAK